MRDIRRLVITGSFIVGFASLLGAQGVAPQSKMAALTNDDVVHLVAVQVSDATVIAVINEAKGTKFDLTAPALGDLVLHGVSTAVIAAMRQPSRPSTATPAKPEAAASAEDSIDRQKFDKVYAAGKAVQSAMFLSAVNVSIRQFQQLLLTFDTEIKIVSDKATTKAEHSLASKYATAELQFDLMATEASMGKVTDTREKASATLDAANKIYLGK